MPHTPSQFMYLMSLHNRYRIKYLQRAEKLLQYGLLEYKYRKLIDIRYLVIGKYAVAQLKHANEEYFHTRDRIRLRKNSLDNFTKLINNFAIQESLAREVLRGRSGI